MLVLSIIILVAAYFVCRVSFDRPAKDAIQIHVFAAKGEWHKVLTIAKRLPMTDRKVIFEVNRALSHLGRLPDEAFNYAQYWGEKGLILTANYSSDVLMLCSDLYFDMGHIKESLHWAYEAQTKLERSPDVMKRIAMNNLILGEYKVAEKFFRILSKSFVHRKWAMHYLACLQDESFLEKELLIQEKRKLLPSWNFYASAEKPQYDLFMLFSEHPENKMAFEYFMVYSMLANDLASVVQNINYLSAMHYHKIPVHIEEALILFKALNEKYPVNLGKYRISSQMQERFVNYSKIIAVYHKDFKAAQPELFDKYGNTYWYYIQYISPLTTKREIHEKKQ
jgi:hypothetical protein